MRFLARLLLTLLRLALAGRPRLRPASRRLERPADPHGHLRHHPRRPGTPAAGALRRPRQRPRAHRTARHSRQSGRRRRRPQPGQRGGLARLAARPALVEEQRTPSALRRKLLPQFATPPGAALPRTDVACTGDDCFRYREIEGYSWLELARVAWTDCHPSSLGCLGPVVLPGHVSLTIIRKCHDISFNGEAHILTSDAGDRFAMHATATGRPDPGPALPQGLDANYRDAGAAAFRRAPGRQLLSLYPARQPGAELPPVRLPRPGLRHREGL